jgi:hypothetical protein
VAVTTIDYSTRIATVTPVVVQKYARKLLQDKIKQETGQRGWFFAYEDELSTKDKMVYKFYTAAEWL